MDIKLMRDFEELEGLIDQLDDEFSHGDEEEDDSSFRPQMASNLNNSEIYYEMEKRNLKTTGFPDTDREFLQRAFDEEFKQDLEDARARRREGRRRAARQAGLQRRRVMMERMLQEEQDELASDHQAGMMIELIKENMVDSSIRVDVNSISARSLAKAMWSNNTITCLDLSSNNLNDHAGSYLARILKRNNTLIKLELDNNSFGSKTCQAFGEALRVNTSLVYLSLDSNPLTSNGKQTQGFLHLTDSLKHNNTLKSLNLYRTCLGVPAGVALANCIEENDTILFCDVGYCGIEMIDIKRIAAKKDANLTQYELYERNRREDERASIEKSKKIKDAEENARKQKDLAQWLESRRDQRAESRRTAEEDRIEELRLEMEEKARILAEDRERERKAAEEAEARKKKKKAKAKGKKK